MDDFDNSAPESHTSAPDKRILIEEHPVGPNDPVSYMAYNNCINAMHEISEIMEMMNLCDELPQWVDQLLSEGADRFKKAKSYILSEKESEPEVVVSYEHDDVEGHPTSETFDYAPQSIGVPMAPTMVTPMNDFDMGEEDYYQPSPKFSSKRYSNDECQQFEKDLTYYVDGNEFGAFVCFVYKGKELGSCYSANPEVGTGEFNVEETQTCLVKKFEHIPGLNLNLEACLDYFFSKPQKAHDIQDQINETLTLAPDYGE